MLAPALTAARVAAIAIVLAAASTSAASASTVGAIAPDPTPPPPVTDNAFIPDERNLSECVGLLDRPGCGSDERGGAGQTAVFVVMLGAMGLIFTRIAVGVRKNRAALTAATTASTGTAESGHATHEPVDP